MELGHWEETPVNRNETVCRRLRLLRKLLRASLPRAVPGAGVSHGSDGASGSSTYDKSSPDKPKNRSGFSGSRSKSIETRAGSRRGSMLSLGEKAYENRASFRIEKLRYQTSESGTRIIWFLAGSATSINPPTTPTFREASAHFRGTSRANAAARPESARSTEFPVARAAPKTVKPLNALRLRWRAEAV